VRDDNNLNFLSSFTFPTIMSNRLSDIMNKQKIRPVAVFENYIFLKNEIKQKDYLKDLARNLYVINLVIVIHFT